MSKVLPHHYRTDGEWCGFSGVTIGGESCPYGCDTAVTSRAEWFRDTGRRDPDES